MEARTSGETGGLFKRLFVLLLAALWSKLVEMFSPRPPEEPGTTPARAKYINYPKGYVKDYTPLSQNDYSRSSPYRSSLDSLYRDDGLIYEKGGFKYRRPINKYET